jgi:hypothetical protein
MKSSHCNFCGAAQEWMTEMRAARWSAAFFAKRTESWSSAGAWYQKASGEMMGPKFPRGGIPVKITSAKVAGIADFTFCIRDRLPGAHSVLAYNSAERGGPGMVASVADFTKHATSLFGETVEVGPPTSPGRCENCGGAQEFIAHLQSGKWKAAFFPQASESWPAAVFYEEAEAELTGPGFPLGGVPLKLHRARVGGIAHLTYRIDSRLPGASSVLLYKSSERGGPGVVLSVDEFAVDAPSYIGLTPEVSQVFYG